MRRFTIAACAACLVLACGSPDPAEPGPSATDSSGAAAAAPSALYDESLTDDPCALLTPAMVASVAGVAVELLEPRQTSGMCIYSWDGGTANIAFIKTYDDPEKAKSRFENEHRNMTGAEVGAAMAEIGERAKERLREEAAAGEDVPQAEEVEPVTGVMADALGGGISFEAIEGVGDMAAYETTRHETEFGDQKFVSYANKLDVLSGNLTFDISFARDEEGGEAKMYRNEAIALARAVLDGLPR